MSKYRCSKALIADLKNSDFWVDVVQFIDEQIELERDTLETVDPKASEKIADEQGTIRCLRNMKDVPDRIIREIEDEQAERKEEGVE